MALLSILIISCFLNIHQALGDTSDADLNPAELIANNGYPVEVHQLITDDGYIITLHRIPHGINDDSESKRPPIFLMHGYTGSAGVFVKLGPDHSLGYLLADAGYDVWLGNARGTTPSRNHTSIDPDLHPEQFFNFTWHEIGYYDLARSIDHILEVNGDDSVYYVGHSQGTTVFLVLLSTRPEYNSKIKVSNLMAPAAVVEHFPNIIIQDVCNNYLDRIWSLLQKYKIYELPDFKKIPEVMAPMYTNASPDFPDSSSSAGLKQYVHYGQLVRDGGFHKWDYGKEGNLEAYDVETAPQYDLSQITAPVAFYYAKNDGQITVEDENAVVNMVPNVVLNYLVPSESFAHSSFVYSNDAVELVYNQIFDILSKY